MKKSMICLVFGIFIWTLLSAPPSFGARIKDIAQLEGVRDNQLVGYGLVVGLNDTGDSANNGITMQTVANMLEHMGMSLNRDAVDVGNVAAVMVTAKLPPFAKAGTGIDVVVSSLGDSESLSGGTLLRTPLQGPDQQVYAVAQGSVIVGGVSMEGMAAEVEKNHPTVGRIPDGGMVEREVGFALPEDGQYVFHLKDGDFTTITRMVKRVNAEFGGDIARAVDSKSVAVDLPADYADRPVQFLSSLENLRVQPDSKARIVVNERTGTIVMGAQVRLSTVAVAHGNIKLTVKESPGVSQPAPLSRGGETVVVPDTEVEYEEEDARFMVMEKGVSIGDVAAALNAIGVTPRDVITIFQAIKAAGAMQAELVIL
ncbi:MAG: flagellar basal body P-ring protein FlgI [Thermodesulfobacteriota bacterium]